MSVRVWQLLTYSERVGEVFLKRMTLLDALKQKKKIIHTGNVVYIGHWQKEAVMGHWMGVLGGMNSKCMYGYWAERDWKSAGVGLASMAGL